MFVSFGLLYDATQAYGPEFASLEAAGVGAGTET